MLFAVSSLRAQDAPRPAGAGTLVGVVTDTLGNRIADADVLIAQLRRRVRTRADGTFRFDGLKVGVYDVSARSIGLATGATRVSVGIDGGAVVIRMVRIYEALPAVVTTATVGGLSGIIGDTAYVAVPDVEVSVVGGNGHARTDSIGAFFVPLKPGRYLVRLARDGYQEQMVGVTIPDDGGRRLAAWMRPKSTDNVMLAVALFESNQRLIREKGVAMRAYTREDLLARGADDLVSVVQGMANRTVTGDCLVSIAGTPGKVPLWQVMAADVEFVELYGTSQGVGAGDPRGMTSISGNPTTLRTVTSVRPVGGAGCGGVGVVVWMRQ